MTQCSPQDRARSRPDSRRPGRHRARRRPRTRAITMVGTVVIGLLPVAATVAADAADAGCLSETARFPAQRCDDNLAPRTHAGLGRPDRQPAGLPATRRRHHHVHGRPHRRRPRSDRLRVPALRRERLRRLDAVHEPDHLHRPRRHRRGPLHVPSPRRRRRRPGHRRHRRRAVEPAARPTPTSPTTTRRHPRPRSASTPSLPTPSSSTSRATRRHRRTRCSCSPSSSSS